jgi:HK97 gp10 family phage protein
VPSNYRFKHAPGGTGFEITGIAELDATLNEMEKRTMRKHVARAVRTVAKKVLAEAKMLVPVDEGELKKSLKIRRAKRSRKLKNQVVDQVFTGEGFFKGDQYYGGFVEYGTVKMSARPFLRPAVYSQKYTANITFRQAVVDSISETSRKGRMKARTASRGIDLLRQHGLDYLIDDDAAMAIAAEAGGG